MADGRLLAYCSRLVERGDTLIDNYGEHYLAAGAAKRTRFDTGPEHVIPVLGGSAFAQLEWKPVDDFRYGHRIAAGTA